MNMRKLKKKWLRAKTNEQRYDIVGEFMSLVVTQLTDGSADMVTIYKQSAVFTQRPIVSQEDPNIDWCLDRDFFLQIMTQVLRDIPALPIVMMFKSYGWDYDRAVRPECDATSTIEEFGVHDIIQGAQSVRLRLVSRVEYPIGSMVTNKRSGLTYEVASHVGNRYELIGDKLTIWRFADDIKKTFDRVVDNA